MTPLVHLERRDDGVAVIRLDNGKVNALSPDMQAEINQALDKAEADGAVVLLTGNQKAGRSPVPNEEAQPVTGSTISGESRAEKPPAET